MKRRIFLLLVVLTIPPLLFACSQSWKQEEINPIPGLANPPAKPSASSPAGSPQISITPTKAVLTSTPFPTQQVEPAGCQRPPDDYSRVTVNGFILNRRTLAMLQQASELYPGEFDLTGWSITQGGFHDEPGGFSTHSGGGVVDLSVMRPGTYTILYDDIEPTIHALRLAGFAAWLRKPDEMYDGSPIHIHAVAIGDKTLSAPVQVQLSGPNGYFRGYNANPAQPDKLIKDPHGAPVLCLWMKEMGYRDLSSVE
jgi:hypothetical protein